MGSKSEKKHDKSTKNRNSKETKKNKKDIKNDEQNKKAKKKGFWKKHRKLAIFIKLIFVLIILACIVGAGAIVALFSNDDWAMSKDDLTLKIIDTIIYDKDGNEIANVSGDEKRRIVSLSEIPENLQNAYIAIEDKRFYEHKGVDLKRTVGATVTYIIHRGHSSYGGSTITQQLIKNLKNDKGDSGLAGIERKIREISRAYKVEKMLSKSQILELYLNTIYVGGEGNLHGVELASRYYFNKSVGDLDLAECAFIAGINHAPNSYNPFKESTDNSELIKKRTTTVLSEMKDQGEAHLHFYHHYPVYYDWWLQDGSDVKWFDKTLPEQISERLQKLQQETKVTNTPESITQALSAYLDACKARREQRLASFIKNTPEVVFTKFRTLRPSFFAYTEGLSDARAECNFFAGGELAYFKMDGIWAKEETLLKDTAGVFRDPDVHFDGKHILFARKKSQKEDDFHLYEMEMPSRKLKQITSGLGFADIEPIYLPDENILFNSTRNGSAVDCWTVEVSNLYLCDREGRYMRQVGFDQVHT